MESELELIKMSGGKEAGRVEEEGGKEPPSVGESEVGKVVSGKSVFTRPWEQEQASKLKKISTDRTNGTR